MCAECLFNNLSLGTRLLFVVVVLSGVTAAVVSARQDYSSKTSTPSWCYKQHLKSLHRRGAITDEKYARLLTGSDV